MLLYLVSSTSPSVSPLSPIASSKQRVSQQVHSRPPAGATVGGCFLASRLPVLLRHSGGLPHMATIAENSLSIAILIVFFLLRASRMRVLYLASISSSSVADPAIIRWNISH